MEIPQTTYTKTIDRVNIAFRVNGTGPLDYVYIMGGPVPDRWHLHRVVS